MFKKKIWIYHVFPFLLIFVLTFIFYRDIFSSYFESDEWYHFTYFLPLTKSEGGFIDALISTIINAGPLSGGQHVNPLWSIIFFLNIKIFGINYFPYALISLSLHATNSFLVFLLVKEYFYPNKGVNVAIIAFISGVFFALSQVPMHAVLWAAFYGQNVLSVTLFLLCLFFFKRAINKGKKAFLYLSLIFLIANLFIKETAAALFFILPIMVVVDKKVFSTKYLLKLFTISFFIFIFFRFVIPNFYFGAGNIIDRLTDNYLFVAKKETAVKDTRTIVSADLSIYKNIYFELISRSVRFPTKMMSELYFPRDVIFSFMQILTPIIYPLPENVSGDEEIIRSQNYNFFSNGPGNDLIIYILSISILLLICSKAFFYYRKKQFEEFRLIIIGSSIVILGSLPLVLIVLSFPRWGFDTYFDSRHYYMPTVGGAVLFPLLLFAVTDLVLKNLAKLRVAIPRKIIITILFFVWFFYNYNSFNLTIQSIIFKNNVPRKKVVYQLKDHMPILPDQAVIYAETDGLGAYGPVLPFQSNIAQALTVIFYDKNPLPDDFFNSIIFEKTGRGYKFASGRGFGFFDTKKDLANALLENKFSIDDVYAFYFKSDLMQLEDKTELTRRELAAFIKDSNNAKNWKIFKDDKTKLNFKYPPTTQILEEKISETNPKLIGKYLIKDGLLEISLSVLSIVPTFDLKEVMALTDGVVEEKRVYFNKYNYIDAYHVVSSNQSMYFVKFTDKIVRVEIMQKSNNDDEAIEKIIGSIAFSE